MADFRTLYGFATAGLRHPRTAVSWVFCSVASTWPRFRYPDQRTLINDLRQTNGYLLVILDACRFDAFASIYGSYFTGDLTRAWSAGYDTFQYVHRCWPDEYPKVVYLSGATPVNSHKSLFEGAYLKSLYGGYRPREHIGTIVDVWNHHWEPELGTCPPGPVADHTITAIENGADRLVAHFFQPHAPYVGKPKTGEFRLLGHVNNKNATPSSGEPADNPIWTAVRNGDISDDELRSAYYANLEAVLVHACRVVKAGLDADLQVVVMADHGEALGEYGWYAHPRGVPNPYLRVIPWLEVSDLQPQGRELARKAPRVVDDLSSEQGASPTSNEPVHDRLQDLGYLD